MTKELFLKIVEELQGYSMDDFQYEHEGKIYTFGDITSEEWESDCTAQTIEEVGRLVLISSSYTLIMELNYGVTRDVTRTEHPGEDIEYTYEYGPYKAFELKDVYAHKPSRTIYQVLKWMPIGEA